MFYVRFPIALPVEFPRTPIPPAGDEFTPVGIVRCWVERETLDEAVSAARRSAETLGWVVGMPHEARRIDAGAYPPGTDDGRYAGQAAVDGECLVFELPPAEPAD